MTPASTHRVAFCDWEFDAWEHKGRMRRLIPNGEQPDILYVPCVGPLRDQVDRLRRIFREHEIRYAVFDSVGLACDGPPEEAQSALGFFEALRRLEVGAFCVAHVNRSGDTERPFGSAYWHNCARATWFVKKQQDTAAERIDLGIFNRKSNTSGLHSPLGFRLTFDELGTRIERTDVRNVPELAVHVALKFRIAHAIETQPKTYRELGDELEVDPETIGRTVRRDLGKLFIRQDDRIALLTAQEVLL
jgi:hypothetical protein